MAISRLGSASMISISRMMKISISPWLKAAIRPSTMPENRASSTTIAPVDRETRAPWMMRERMSRPMSSVPSRKRVLPPSTQAGGARKASRYCSAGGCGATTSAKIAARAMTTITTRPASAPRLSRKAFQISVSGWGGACNSPTSSTSISSSGALFIAVSSG